MSKALFFSLLLLGTFTKVLNAQTITYCGIWFDYDAAGNRISRYPGCKTFDTGGIVIGNPPNAKMIKNSASNNIDEIPVVSPNPTGGRYKISIAGNDALVNYEWYSLDGQVIDKGSFQGNTYNGDVSRFPPGNYFLKLFWEGKSYRYKMTKDK
ncbi:MAG: T9SS type A sorting domain-containing protein [Chitinophagaceae bacterium]